MKGPNARGRVKVGGRSGVGNRATVYCSDRLEPPSGPIAGFFTRRAGGAPVQPVQLGPVATCFASVQLLFPRRRPSRQAATRTGHRNRGGWPVGATIPSAGPMRGCAAASWRLATGPRAVAGW